MHEVLKWETGNLMAESGHSVLINTDKVADRKSGMVRAAGLEPAKP